jgi:hypothetical protein
MINEYTSHDETLTACHCPRCDETEREKLLDRLVMELEIIANNLEKLAKNYEKRQRDRQLNNPDVIVYDPIAGQFEAEYRRKKELVTPQEWQQFYNERNALIKQIENPDN